MEMSNFIWMLIYFSSVSCEIDSSKPNVSSFSIPDHRDSCNFKAAIDTESN